MTQITPMEEWAFCETFGALRGLYDLRLKALIQGETGIAAEIAALCPKFTAVAEAVLNEVATKLRADQVTADPDQPSSQSPASPVVAATLTDPP